MSPHKDKDIGKGIASSTNYTGSGSSKLTSSKTNLYKSFDQVNSSSATNLNSHHSHKTNNKVATSNQNGSSGVPPSGMLNHNSATNSNNVAYDDLKKRLLNEYKKLCSSKKNFDD
eukprot:CAMPEP_0116875186 /NCGR_PEP_ID=MMETSP0463-20121206/6989_1 /TAXON_ID=181622 /ORGANISM="Strombidinopsis sp, Strain SopsisLIS2011" /LENGTH=114 /DNA_ID=CAMNT_0004520261 /DNA_START=495 /DNA_END=839 /DNA_ORIENTATION=+